MKEGKADNEHSNPVLLPLVPEFTNICISHLQLLHFQKFLLEVVAIGRKNAGWESDTADQLRKKGGGAPTPFYVRLFLIRYLKTRLTFFLHLGYLLHA